MSAGTSSNIPQLTVTKLRIVAHTMGAMVPGGVLSQNHWSIYLLVADGGSVRLNMEWTAGTVGNEGTFTVKKHAYPLTNSAVKAFDYDVAVNSKVQAFLRTVADKKRQNYEMTSGGVGCRFWVLTVFQDWVQAGLVVTPNAAAALASAVEYNYSKGQSPVKLEMKRGKWL